MKKIGSNQKRWLKKLAYTKARSAAEMRRNTGERGYRPKQAHEKALERRSKAQLQIGAAVWEMVEEKLRQDWSPEQVSGWLEKHQEIRISHEWIYQYILTEKQAGGDLYNLWC